MHALAGGFIEQAVGNTAGFVYPDRLARIVGKAERDDIFGGIAAAQKEICQTNGVFAMVRFPAAVDIHFHRLVKREC